MSKNFRSLAAQLSPIAVPWRWRCRRMSYCAPSNDSDQGADGFGRLVFGFPLRRLQAVAVHLLAAEEAAPLAIGTSSWMRRVQTAKAGLFDLV